MQAALSCSQPSWRCGTRVRAIRGARVSCLAGLSTAVQPDLLLRHPETGTNIHIFGVEHATLQPHIGEEDWRHRQDNL